jgi:hypothetical protein
MKPAVLSANLIAQTQLHQQLTREYLTTGINNLDALVNGFPRGAITELFGVASSGCTTVLQSFLSSATNQGEYCALVDASSTFDPISAAAAGVDLDRLLWVRCNGSIEKALKCTDLLIHAGGWGVIVMDLVDIPPQIVRRLPISYWYRFRRAVEHTPTTMVVMEREPYVKACASLALELTQVQPIWTGAHPDFRLLKGTRMRVMPKKPVQRETASFEAQALG